MSTNDIRGLDLPDVPDWSTSALCAQADPDAWYPRRGQSSRPAKQICARCPVRAECLEAGLHERFGIWGGLTRRQREALRRDLCNTPAHAHGQVLQHALDQANQVGQHETRSDQTDDAVAA